MSSFNMSGLPDRTESRLSPIKLTPTFREALKKLSDERLEKMLSGMQRLSTKGSTPLVREIGSQGFHTVQGIQRLRSMGDGRLGRA